MRNYPSILLRQMLPFASVSISLLLAGLASAQTPEGWSSTVFDGGVTGLGVSIATTDSLLVIGAPVGAAPGGSSPVGTVLVASSDGGVLTPVQTLAATTPVNGGDFGTSVAASGDLIAVGAPGTPAAAYVFSSTGATYAISHTWSDPSSDANKSLGSCIAVWAGGGVQPNFVAVGAPPSSAGAQGVVYVAEQDPTSGTWSDPLTAVTDSSATSFGISVAFAGNGQLLVGDPDTNDGQVLVYTHSDAGWALEGPLPAVLDGGTMQSFGTGIATSDNLAVVTAPGSADNAGTYAGAAFVFAFTDAGWEQQAVLTAAPTESAFGNFIPAINAAFIAIGSATYTASSGYGQVDVWAASGGNWVPAPSSSLVGDSYFGEAVGVAGNTLYVGDTSANAVSGNQVTSLIFTETPIEGDGGTMQADAAAGQDASQSSDASQPSDAGHAVDAASSDGSTIQDAASETTDAAGSSAKASSSNGGGCSVGTAGGGGSPHESLLAIFVLFVLFGLVVARARRSRCFGAF